MKTITNNVRQNNQLAILHLFEFDMRDINQPDNLIQNSTFNDTTNWALIDSDEGVISGGKVTKTDFTSGLFVAYTLPLNLTSGDEYTIRWEVSGTTQGYSKASNTKGGLQSSSYQRFYGNGEHTQVITAESHTDTYDFYMTLDPDFDGSIDNVRVYKGATLFFTDHDIFVDDTRGQPTGYTANEYTPLAITFDKLSEDGSMQSDSININIDNVSGALTTEALASEWRNNRAKITRVIYTPNSDIIDSETYEYGYGDNLDSYPKLSLADVSSDSYTLFEGIIDTFSATEQALNATITSLFANWNKPYPSRTYSQNDFTSVIGAIADSIYWGRKGNPNAE